MGIEGGSSNNEVQKQEINQSTNEQIEQNQVEHQRSGEELEGNSTIDNEGERKQIEGKDDATESSEDDSSRLDSDDSIENDNNQEQPAENEAVSPEQQQLDNQDTIEGDSSSADGMSENDQEITDSLDAEDSIEDEDLTEMDDSAEDEGSSEDLNQEGSIKSDDSNDVNDMEEESEEGDGSLVSDDSIEDEDTEDTEDSEEPIENTEEAENTEEPVEDTEEAEDTEEPVEDTDDAEDSVEYSETDGETSDTGEKEKLEEYHDIGEFNDELNGIYSDGSMSNQEKVDAAKGCVDKLNHSDLSPEEKKQSVDVPSDARVLKNPENSDWTEKTDDNPWPPLNIDFPDKMGLDYDKDISPIGREEGSAQLPDTGFRYGGEGGYNYTCEKADGNVPALDERALPKEYVPEKDREVHFDNGRYCDAIDAISGYESDPAASLDSINGMIDDINAERGSDIQHLDEDELEALSDRYQQLQDTEFADVRDELGTDDRDFTKYGVHGYAKSMEDASGDTICEGGADQFNTALPEYMLKRIGVEY